MISDRVALFTSQATRCISAESSATCIAFDLKSSNLAIGTQGGDVFIHAVDSKGRVGFPSSSILLDKTAYSAVKAVYSTHGDLLLVAFMDKSIRCYDAHKHVCRGILREHRRSILHLESSPNAAEFMSVSSDGLILWDARTLARKKTLGGGPHGLSHASYSSDGHAILALFTNGTISVWSASTFAHTRTFGLIGDPGVQRLLSLQTTFSVSGSLLVSGGPNLPFLLVWSFSTGSLLYGIPIPCPQNSSIEGVIGRILFLPDSTLLIYNTRGLQLCILTSLLDGVKVINLGSSTVGDVLPHSSSAIEMDLRGNHLALLTHGKVFLHDLRNMRKDGDPTAELPRIDPLDLENAAASRSYLPLVAPSRGKAPRQQTSNQEDDDAPKKRGVFPRKDQDDVTLPRLQQMLKAFGEYPSRYRLSIYEQLLSLPRNKEAYKNILNKGLHPSCKALESSDHFISLVKTHGKYLGKQVMLSVSALAWWCPMFASSEGFGPKLVFPFVKLFQGVLKGADGSETCKFEILATFLSSFTRGWFDAYPRHPVGILVRCCELMRFHDEALFEHLSAALQGAEEGGGVSYLVWALLSTLMSDALAQTSWLKLIDHLFTSLKPDFLYCSIAAYLIAQRDALLKSDTARELNAYLSGPPPTDITSVIQRSYHLLSHTPPELLPNGGRRMEPLPQSSIIYHEMKDVPLGAVQLHLQERQRIEEAEEALSRRRRVVSELEVRSRTTALQAATLEQERVQLVTLQAKRREQMRRTEAQLLVKMSQLDDRVKEEQLKQVHIVEAAYQRQLAMMREEWQKEVQDLKVEIRHRQEIVSLQTRSKEEEEAIKRLDFEARERMKALQQAYISIASKASLRFKVDAKIEEGQARVKERDKQWAAEDEARLKKMEHEDARSFELARQAEEMAAQAAVEKELLMGTNRAEDEASKAAVARRLRMLEEDEAALTTRSRQIELSQIQANYVRTMTEQAARDMSWFESEASRRKQVMTRDRSELEAELIESKRQMLDQELRIRVIQGETALNERRRGLERQNHMEEVQARRELERNALERSRHAQLKFEMEAKKEAQEIHLVAEKESPGNETQGSMKRRHQEAMQALRARRNLRVKELEAPSAGPSSSQSSQGSLPKFSGHPAEPSEMDVLRAMEKMRGQERMRSEMTAATWRSDSPSSASSGGSSGNSISATVEKALNDGGDSVNESSETSFPTSSSHLPLLSGDWALFSGPGNGSDSLNPDSQRQRTLSRSWDREGQETRMQQGHRSDALRHVPPTHPPTRHTSDGSISTEEMAHTPLLKSHRYVVQGEEASSHPTPISELSDVSDVDGLLSRMRGMLAGGSSVEGLSLRSSLE